MEKKFQPKIKMIVGVSNIWLQDILMEIVDGDRYEMVFSQDLRREDLSCHKIAVVDIDDYPVRCSQLFQEMNDRRPGIGIVAVVSDSAAYGDKIIQMGANAVVGKDELIDRFAGVLETLVHGLWLEGQTRRLLRVKNFLKKEKNAVKKTTENKSGFFKPISRRTFLTGSAAAMAALAITACADTGETEEQTTAAPALETTPTETQPSVEPVTPPAEEIYYGSCRANCFGGCRMKIKVRDGRVVASTMGEMPDPRYNRICAKGLSHVTRIYDPERLKAPMKRVGERGSGQWEQITWDEAIKEITDSWKKIQAESGDEAVAFMNVSGNFGSISSGAAGRLKAMMGGSTIGPCVDANLFTATMKAFMIADNYNGSELVDLLNAKTIMIWGSNPCDAQIQNWKFIRQAQKAGAKIICVDPNYTTTAARSDIWVPIKPGADGLLALAMCNIVIEKGWIDEEYLKFKSVAPFLVKESDGKYLRTSDLRALEEGETDAILVWDEETKELANSATATKPALTGAYYFPEVGGTTTAYELLLERLK
ncbi:MAG: molybdopterin-dependent oxidoreductase, partial [Lachnospiraceae bacterium]|nr:molybdopterin-dependent oxidoreductase [Lachnospiraceae bacterium]